MTFFMEHAMAYLNDSLVSKQETSLEKYKHVMVHHCEKLHSSKPHYLITKIQKTTHMQLLKGQADYIVLDEQGIQDRDLSLNIIGLNFEFLFSFKSCWCDLGITQRWEFLGKGFHFQIHTFGIRKQMQVLCSRKPHILFLIYHNFILLF